MSPTVRKVLQSHILIVSSWLQHNWSAPIHCKLLMTHWHSSMRRQYWWGPDWCSATWGRGAWWESVWLHLQIQLVIRTLVSVSHRVSHLSKHVYVLARDKRANPGKVGASQLSSNKLLPSMQAYPNNYTEKHTLVCNVSPLLNIQRWHLPRVSDALKHLRWLRLAIVSRKATLVSDECASVVLS